MVSEEKWVRSVSPHIFCSKLNLTLLLNVLWQNYSRYAISHPGQCKVVAIAEPRPATRKQFAEQHHVDQSLVFETWEQLLAASQDTLDATGRRLADAVLVTVQDDMHLDVTKAFAKQSYHILCEKPMATTAEGCVEMAVAVEKAGIIFGMGHGGTRQ